MAKKNSTRIDRAIEGKTMSVNGLSCFSAGLKSGGVTPSCRLEGMVSPVAGLTPLSALNVNPGGGKNFRK